MAVRVINVHFIQRLADGLGDDPYGVYRLFGFLIERTGLVVFYFYFFLVFIGGGPLYAKRL